jgi:hypothetical protein
MSKVVFLTLILALGALFAVACDDSQEQGMAIFGVSDINGGAAITGATANAVPMTFRWRPYFDTNASIVEAAPHGDYVIDTYKVTWTAVTAGATVPGTRQEATSIFVPVYALVTSDIILATPAEAATVTAGALLNAHVDFTAHEMGTTKDAKFGVTVSVHF